MKRIIPVKMSSTKLEFLSVDPEGAEILEEKHREAEWRYREKMARINHGVKVFGAGAFSLALLGLLNSRR